MQARVGLRNGRLPVARCSSSMQMMSAKNTETQHIAMKLNTNRSIIGHTIDISLSKEQIGRQRLHGRIARNVSANAASGTFYLRNITLTISKVICEYMH